MGTISNWSVSVGVGLGFEVFFDIIFWKPFLLCVLIGGILILNQGWFLV